MGLGLVVALPVACGMGLEIGTPVAAGWGPPVGEQKTPHLNLVI